jgi:ABC-type polysaccharide/polyol phosphate export permease
MRRHLLELLAYRELLINLVIRNLKVRYKDSIFGFLWSLINPLMMMIVFTVVFQFLRPTNQIHDFPVFALCAILPWNFFSSSLSRSVNSIVANAHLLKKVYFPREVLPISAVASGLVNFLLALLVLFCMLFLFGIGLTKWALLLPLVILAQFAFALGLAFILSTLNVFYRDTSIIMDVVLQAWFFLTPVMYPIDLLPPTHELLGVTLPVQRMMYIVNPMASIIASYRTLLYGSISGAPPGPPAWDFFSRTMATALIFLLLGYAVFIHYSPRFGEEV